ncbi:tubulin-specific chaperone A-like isoform X2 [Oncorhynchus keta]|uniref:tubulin-specific chaperone A-like isoform X2 n=1 Tax=Oncorhynchus keta TaxID=8018 RepID=UPI0015FB8364|nr:tubulin-specific chaperone A-like isoform X2 [Oncorhynchus keta]
MADPRIRQIKIKTGVVKRLVKEKVMYVKETRQQEEKIERLKTEACDEEADSEAKYVIKKQFENVSSDLDILLWSAHSSHKHQMNTSFCSYHG